VTAAFGKFSEKDDDGPTPRRVGQQGTSIIGPGAELVGDLTGSGQLRIEGRVDGTIRMDGEVQVAAGGAVEGRIEADSVVTAGRIDGTIAARDAVRLEDGCQVEADVFSPVLELMEGGMLDGRVDMSGSGLPEEPDLGGTSPGGPSGPGTEPPPAEGEGIPAPVDAAEEEVGEDDEDDEDEEVV
jgi:cytoskeletal protein CcmA (bactofilin family)